MGFTDSWDDHRLTCMHGIREGLDSHECAACFTIALATGEDTSNGKTYLYRKDPRSAKSEASHAA